MDYRNVKASKAHLKEFLEHSKGGRDVPLIIDEGKITIGFGGA